VMCDVVAADSFIARTCDAVIDGIDEAGHDERVFVPGSGLGDRLRRSVRSAAKSIMLWWNSERRLRMLPVATPQRARCAAAGHHTKSAFTVMPITDIPKFRRGCVTAHLPVQSGYYSARNSIRLGKADHYRHSGRSHITHVSQCNRAVL
jgi:hypothetical protein